MISLHTDERRIYLWSLAVYACNGVAFGVFANADVIAARALHASPGGVALLMFLLNASLIFSLPLVRWMGTGRLFRRRLSRMAWACTFLLFVYPFFPSLTAFIPAVFAVHLLNTVLPPIMNRLYDRHLSHSLGKLYGWATSLRMAAGMGAAVATGALLDFDDRMHVPLLAAAALLALLSCHLLSRMEPDTPDTAMPGPLWEHMRETAACVRDVLARDADFMRFERNFIVYGLGFLLLTPVIPLYLVRELHLDYSVISSSRQVVGQAAIWLLSPVAGSWFDRTNPFVFTGISFSILLGFPLFMAAAAGFPFGAAAVVIAYGILSIAMTGISIAWNIGSIRFSQNAEPGLYQGVHVTLTGVRSLFGPLLGWMVLTLSGYRAAFALAAALFAAAAWLMLQDPARRRDLSARPVQTPPLSPDA